jgi:hypothetical protein
MRHRWLWLVLLAACGTTDDRKPTSDVVVLEIMRPTCGQVQCHGSTTQSEGLAFDTIEHTKASIMTEKGAHILDALHGAPGYERMPPDSPLQDSDLDLIEQWISMGMPDTLP